MEEEQQQGPMGRVGHVISISADGYFHVFGGLLYKEKMFYVEDEPFVWRVKIGDVLSSCRGHDDDDENGNDAEKQEEEEDDEKDSETEEGSEQETEVKKKKKALVWEKIRPKIVVDSLPSFYADFNDDDLEENGDGTTGGGDVEGGGNEEGETSEEEKKAIGNGDDQKEDEDESYDSEQMEETKKAHDEDNEQDDQTENNKPPNRQRRTIWTMVGNNNDNNNDDENTSSSATSNNTPPNTEINKAIATYPDNDPSIYLPRGEAQGGHWSTTNTLIIYGGLHVTEIPNPHHHSYMKTIQVDKTTGDVWLYQYTTQTFYLLSSYPPPAWQRDATTGRYPVARTSHAATIVNDELIVHGGMAMDETHKNWDGTTSWDPLSDVWVFDLKRRVWRERVMVPELARSYHSLVGWGEGSVASFGGFRTAQTVGGEPIAFVFSDTIISHPDNPQWLKASYPDHAQYTSSKTPQPSSPSSSSTPYFPAVTISNRLEHNAVLNKDGQMYVWGGRFKTVDQISGTWILNVFGSNTAVSFEEALEDGLEAYEAELEALHLLVGIMLFMSIMFTALYGTLRRQTEEHMNGGGVANGGGTIFARSRRGLSREAIDALPVKTYNRSAAKAAAAAAEAAVDSFFDKDASKEHENNAASASENGNSEEEHYDDVGLDNEPSMPAASTTEGSTEPSSPLGAEVEEEDETCPICLVEYEDGDEVRQLPCGHEFHVDCIDSWLEAHTSCPSCRNELSNSVTPTSGDSNSSREGGQSTSTIRQATNMMLGIDDDDMFLTDMIRANLGGYVRNNRARREDEEEENMHRSEQEQPSLFPLVPTMSLSSFLAGGGPESNWFFRHPRPHEMGSNGESSDVDGRMAGGETTTVNNNNTEAEQDEQVIAEQEYIPRDNNPEEARPSSRGRLSDLGIPRRLQRRRRRGGATEMVTIRRHDTSSEEDLELTIV